MFCVPGLVFDGTEVVRSSFHVLHARTPLRRYRGRRFPFSCLARLTRFRRYRGCRVPCSCFTCPDTFSAVSRASGPVFMFCAPGLIFDGTEVVRSNFRVLHARTPLRRYRGRRVPFSCLARPDSFSVVPWASGPVFIFCAPGLVFGGTEVVGSCFHVLSALTRFRWYRGRRVPFSYFTRPKSCSAVPRVSGPIS
jgi:hypothetical protein